MHRFSHVENQSLDLIGPDLFTGQRAITVQDTELNLGYLDFEMSKASPTPQLDVRAAISFLKETKGMLTWSTKDFAKAVGIKITDATPALQMLQIQGYIKPAEHKTEWMTTIDGDTISGAASPRFDVDTVNRALDDLRARIKATNNDQRSIFKITKAVAFGDFQSDRPRVQAADVGIEFDAHHRGKRENAPAQRRAFLKALRAGKQMIKLVPFEEWMQDRTHRKLL